MHGRGRSRAAVRYSAAMATTSRARLGAIWVLASAAGAFAQAGADPAPTRPPATAASPAAAPATELRVSGLTEDDPLQVRATATTDALEVEVVLADEWHLYGRDTGNGKPIEFTARKGSSFAPAGKPTAPMDGKGEITGTARIRVPLRRTADGTTVDIAFRFMVCDPLQCLPPHEVLLQGDLGAAAPMRVLLAVVERGERSARIATWLEEQGVACTVATYAEVTAEQCDSSDVVVADSPYFGQSRGARAAVQKFPQTTAPVVAVGFLGTQLLEANKIAMACGYI